MKVNAKIIIFLLIFIPKTTSPTGSRLAANWTDFFEIVTKIKEENFAKKSFEDQKKDLLDKEDFKKNAGTYYEFSVEYLRKKTKDMPAFQQPGFFKILYNIPIQELLDDDKFNGAAVQSASTIQALEGGMWRNFKDKKKKQRVFLNDMQQHAVQGETLAFCTLYGNIQRKYYYNAILHTAKLPQDWTTKEQSDDDFKQMVESYSNITGSDPWEFGINLLSAYGKFTVDRNKNISNLPDPTKQDNAYDKVKIGYQYKTNVAFKGDKNNIIKTQNRANETLSNQALIKQDKDFWVDQVISFAINLNKNQIHNYDTSSQHNKEIAKKVLFATYNAAIRAAFYKSRQKILLTAVGTGAFKNPSEWVVEAIKNMSDFIVEKNMQVYLVLFDPRKTLRAISQYDDLAKEITQKFTDKETQVLPQPQPIVQQEKTNNYTFIPTEMYFYEVKNNNIPTYDINAGDSDNNNSFIQKGYKETKKNVPEDKDFILGLTGWLYIPKKKDSIYMKIEHINDNDEINKCWDAQTNDSITNIYGNTFQNVGWGTGVFDDQSIKDRALLFEFLINDTKNIHDVKKNFRIISVFGTTKAGNKKVHGIYKTPDGLYSWKSDFDKNGNMNTLRKKPNGDEYSYDKGSKKFQNKNGKKYEIDKKSKPLWEHPKLWQLAKEKEMNQYEFLPINLHNLIKKFDMNDKYVFKVAKNLINEE